MTVPDEVTRVAVSGPLTQIYAIPLVGDLMVGVSNYIAEDIEKYLPDYISTLPELGQLYGGGPSSTSRPYWPPTPTWS